MLARLSSAVLLAVPSLRAVGPEQPPLNEEPEEPIHTNGGLFICRDVNFNPP
ncbi:hypothetical protein PM082_008163 [Marasmius tenuissimus]|nr:hypothetical protein PM082_008163 [Marasmius tenuissimus]